MTKTLNIPVRRAETSAQRREDEDYKRKAKTIHSILLVLTLILIIAVGFAIMWLAAGPSK